MNRGAAVFNSTRPYSKWSIIFIAAFIIAVSFLYDLWNSNRIVVDVPDHYTYLPAAFIYHDIKLSYLDSNPEFFKDKTWFYTLANGNRMIKHPMGSSVALSPFFFIGHLIAPVFGYPQDGYSLPYQNAMSIGVIIYLVAGLIFLRKILLYFFSEKIIALTLISIVAGTNFLWYITFEGLMNHAVSFALIAFCMFTFHRWLQYSEKKYILFFSAAFGLIVLIRPLSVTLALYFLIIGIIKNGGIKGFIIFIKQHLLTLIICVLIVSIIFFPQLLYWKYLTGHWYFDAYIDEHFYFNHPQIFPFLFSFRKGWLIYTPVMWFAVFGFFRLIKIDKAYFFSTLISVLLSIFIYASWWAWNYGISWGMRPMIDYYTILSLPMAACFSFLISKKRIIAYLTYFLISIFIALNLFQTWQYKNGLIHYDSMTRQAYFIGFFQTKTSPGWQDALKPFDWERYKKDLPQLQYSKTYFEKITQEQFLYLRAFNLNYLSAGRQSDYIVTGNYNETGEEELFHLVRISGDTVALKSSNGKFVTVKNELKGMMVADAVAISNSEKFILTQINEDDNRITLKALNGKYVSVTPNFPNIVGAIADKVSSNEIFRIYIVEQQ